MSFVVVAAAGGGDGREAVESLYRRMEALGEEPDSRPIDGPRADRPPVDRPPVGAKK